MPKRKRRMNYNRLTPNINNLNNERVHYHGNIGVRINSTIGKHNPTKMMGSPINTRTLGPLPFQKELPKNPGNLGKTPINPQIRGSEKDRLMWYIENRIGIIDKKRKNISGPGFFGFFKPSHANMEVRRKRAKIEGKNPIMEGASRKKPKTRKTRKKRKTRKRKQKIEKRKQTKKSNYIP